MVDGGDCMTAVKLNVMSDSQIQTIGMKALQNKLGVVGTVKFLEQFDNGGYGDFTADKYNEEDQNLTVEEIMNLFN